MEAIFGPESYLFDPSAEAEYDSNSFLSFSSLSALSPPSWTGFSFQQKEPSRASVSEASTGSASPSDPFEIITAAFDQTFSSGENIGIFHTPTKPTSRSEQHSQPPQPQPIQHHSSSSTDSWGTPITPSLTNRSSSDTFAFNSKSELYLTPAQLDGFSWDDSAPAIAGPSYTPSTPTHQAHRVASNPVLGSTSRLPRTIKPISSMPALKEEEQAASASQWYNPADFLDNQSLQLAAAPIGQPDKSEEALVDDFDWVFGNYGLGEPVSADSTMFAAFQTDLAPPANISSSRNGGGLEAAFESNQVPIISGPPSDVSWMAGPTTQAVADLTPVIDLSQTISQPSIVNFTIDPTAVMSSNGMDDDLSRPSSAPGLNGGEGSRGMLSVPMADVMMRSLSSEGYVPSRHAPHRDLFSYAPQQIPSGPPGPQPLYTCDPSPSYNAYGPTIPSFSQMPPTPTPKGRAASHGLTIQINPPPFSTYVPSPLPPTPQSATFASDVHLQPQPMPMQRAGTNPLPAGVKGMGMGMGINMYPSSLPKSSNLPPHLARAQAIVQMQEAREEAERQAIRRETASRRVGMADASVMQQQQQQQLQQQQQTQTIMGWEGPSSQTGSMPIMTSAPLIVHPPPMQYNLVSGGMTSQGQPQVQRIHPPPHPGTSGRPMARLPTSPIKSRKASAPVVSTSTSTSSSNLLTPTRPNVRARTASTPNGNKSRSPSGRKKTNTTPSGSGSGPGNFSWGETTFINYTSNDAEKLLTGVAPSGSQSKRKREESQLPMPMLDSMTMVAVDGERIKRSRSNE